MKRIVVVTETARTSLGQTLGENLREVLGDRVEVAEASFDRLAPGEQLEADLVLVMLKSRAPALKRHGVEARRILVVQRTIRSREVYPIFAIPPGTKVLVVNDHPETTLETVALLQQLDIHHLAFVPFEEGLDWGDIRIAVTPGERSRVPAGIPTVLDLGHRCLDISTFIELIDRLGLKDPEVDRRLQRYAEGIVPLDTGVNRQFRELYLRNTELDSVVNLAHEGILLLNSEDRISLCNRALREMLELAEDPTGSPVAVLPAEVREVLAHKTEREWILEHRGRSLVVTRKAIQSFGEPAGHIFNFQEVTYIRQLEQNLSRRLREKGHIARYHFSDVLTRSPRMRQCVELARRIAGSDFTVLVLGESGTGKELLAQSIHNESARARQPFVAVNCAAVPENLLESELFGYEGGSFTGALREGKRGLFEQANHGTVFLDEIADMPLVLQAKLLRVLQERQIMRVGSQKVISVNIRVIAATNHDLRQRIREGRFREDLYYRLNALPLLVPPLRERPEDILPLLEHFLAEHRQGPIAFTPAAREHLLRYAWPGNIRELANVASYLSFMSETPVDAGALPFYLQDEPREAADLRCGPERALAVLEALARRGRGAGRRSLGEALAGRFTEGEVRSTLRELQDAGFIRSRTGRGGSELTEAGRRCLGTGTGTVTG